MPNTEANQNYDSNTESVSFWMVFTTVYTLVLSFFLNKALKKLLATFLSIQIIIHMFLLANPFPGNIFNIISKLKPLLSFNILQKLSGFVEMRFQFDSLGQIAMREFIMPKAK
jgi:hypothetical protein